MACQKEDVCLQSTQERTAKIARLNDQLRRGQTPGQVFVTEGILNLGESAAVDMLSQVRDYDDFTKANDPHGERDFGAFRYRGDKVFWKIDYYDPELKFGSEDPADPAQTCRVLTVMLAREY